MQLLDDMHCRARDWLVGQQHRRALSERVGGKGRVSVGSIARP